MSTVLEYLESLPYPQPTWEKDFGNGAVHRRRYLTSGQVKLLAKESGAFKPADIPGLDNQTFYYDINHDTFGSMLPRSAHDALVSHIKAEAPVWREKKRERVQLEMDALRCSPEVTMRPASRIAAEDLTRRFNQRLHAAGYEHFDLVLLGATRSEPDQGVYELRYFGERWARGYLRDMAAEVPKINEKLVKLERATLQARLPEATQSKKVSMRI